jgi:glycosyltransferase involved in cell wall biosynthesis
VRILILHSRYLSGDVSGENRVVDDESRLLREAGHDVRVWAPEPDVDRPAGQIRAGISAIWSTSAARAVEQTVRRHRIEIVHIHNLFPTMSPAVIGAAGKAGAGVVMTLHNYRLMCLPGSLLREGRICELCVGHVPWEGVRHRCYRGSTAGSAVLATSLSVHRAVGSFGRVDRFLAVSDFVRTKHIEAGLPPERISVRANFAWPTAMRTGPGDRFLFAGRLAPEKGVDVLLRAWAEAPELLPLVVVGDGPEEARLRDLAPPGVEFRGRVTAAEMPSLMQGARALLVPSRWYEAALPKVVLEAYAAGVPAVVADIGALHDGVVDGVSGHLVPPEEPTAWADALRRLTAPGEAERLGAGAHEVWAERYSPERGLAALESAYRDVLGPGAPGEPARPATRS